MTIEPKKLAFWNAQGFHEAALRCRYPMSTIEPLAMIVNFALACELYLKCAYLIAGRQATGHDLQKLFQALPPATRAELRHLYDQGETVGLDATLTEIASAFVDWRYIHEKGAGDVRHGALEQLAQCLRY